MFFLESMVITPHLCRCPVLSTHGRTENQRIAVTHIFTSSAVTDALQPKHPPPVPSLSSLFFFPNLAAQMHIPSHELVSGLLPLACSALYEWVAPFSKNMRTSLFKHSELPNIPPTWVILGSKYKAMTLPALTVALEKVTAMNKSPRETYSGCHHS